MGNPRRDGNQTDRQTASEKWAERVATGKAAEWRVASSGRWSLIVLCVGQWGAQMEPASISGGPLFVVSW